MGLPKEACHIATRHEKLALHFFGVLKRGVFVANAPGPRIIRHTPAGRQERDAMYFTPGYRACYVALALSILAILPGCSDVTEPSRLSVPGPQRDYTVTDWYECVSFDGGYTWTRCEYTGTTVTGTPEITGPGDVSAPADCSTDPSVCTEAYNGGGGTGGGTRSAPPTSTSMSLGASGYCFSNGLCSPDADAASAEDVCNGASLGDLCTPTSPAPPPEWLAWAGLAPQLDGCPLPSSNFGVIQYTVRGTYNGEPVLYEVGAKRKEYLGGVLGFEEVAVYAMVVKFYAPDGTLKRFGGPAMVDCANGSYIGVGTSR